MPIRGRNKEIYTLLICTYLKFLTPYIFFICIILRGVKFYLIKYNSNYHTLHFILFSQTQHKFVKIKKGEIIDFSNNQS